METTYIVPEVTALIVPLRFNRLFERISSGRIDINSLGALSVVTRDSAAIFRTLGDILGRT